MNLFVLLYIAGGAKVRPLCTVSAEVRTRPVHSPVTNVINKNSWKKSCKCRKAGLASSRTRRSLLDKAAASVRLIGAPLSIDNYRPSSATERS